MRLYDELQGLGKPRIMHGSESKQQRSQIWPSRGLWHSTYVDWQAIYPARVLEHPEDFE